MKKITQFIQYNKRLLLCGCLIWAMPLLLPAQHTDTLLQYRQFVTICNQYKMLPLQAVVQVYSHINMPGNSADTVIQEAAFYLDSSGSYIRYGEVEQLVNDSLMLLVSNQARKMMLYSGKQNLTAQLQKVSGFLMADSSVQKLAGAFTVQAQSVEQQALAGLVLQSRSCLPVSALPRQEIQVQYQLQTGQPVQVVQTARELVPLQPAEYEILRHQPDNENRLVVTEGGYYLIRKRTDIFRYQSVTHHSHQPLPVTLSSRIARGVSGEFHPTDAFKDYSLTLF
ncbi:hypothetical protein HNQ91_003105 [Filimonas zeae]|nr:hypothetical protein [Filimonas zeae]MDR6340040.1 hypothetical protein [Filimonas zeae]